MSYGNSNRKGSDKGTLALVEVVQAQQFDISEGTIRSSFIIQKVADYDDFKYTDINELESYDDSDSEKNEEKGTGGKFLLRIFMLTNDLKVKLCRKILLNNLVEY